MGEVIHLNTYKAEKQYQTTESMNINLALDNVKVKKNNIDVAKQLQLGYMKLLSK